MTQLELRVFAFMDTDLLTLRHKPPSNDSGGEEMMEKAITVPFHLHAKDQHRGHTSSSAISTIPPHAHLTSSIHLNCPRVPDPKEGSNAEPFLKCPETRAPSHPALMEV